MIHTLSTINPYLNLPIQKDTLNPKLFQIQHIPHLPQSDVASNLLKKLEKEFLPIVQRRGYLITSLSELCCCVDSQHYRNSTKTNAKSNKKISNNILGYNQTVFTNPKTHSIHIRLRYPNSHTFYEYYELVGTMCHELAHCEHMKHDDMFYKLMDDIQDQYDVYQEKGVRNDSRVDIINNGGVGKVLGGIVNRNTNMTGIKAMERLNRSKGGVYRLGGTTNKEKKLTPKEESYRAAERRRRDNTTCWSCNIQEESGDCTFIEEKSNACIIGEKSKSFVLINLTDDMDTPKKGVTYDLTMDMDSWSCSKCTLDNNVRVTSCEVCNTPRYNDSDNINDTCIQRILQQDTIENIKKREVEMSKEEYGGFNIYGSDECRSTRTMKHIT